MAQIDANLSTGLPGLDKTLKGLIPGDNVVWHVESVDDYHPFIEPYCADAKKRGHRLIYFRFAKHPPLVDAKFEPEVYELNADGGFETFLAQIHAAIEATGHGGFYVFDCLSELTVDWYSDQMLANFFVLTCPYLYDVEAIAYFALLRNYHSSNATAPISETAQVLIDVYRHKGQLYVQPTKVQQRHSSTMYMLHSWEGDTFAPVKQSAMIAEVLTSGERSRLASAGDVVGLWDRTFLRAEQVQGDLERGEATQEETDEYFDRLIQMAISRDERVIELIRRYMTLGDVIAIGKRQIGTGLIGGKSVGMLLARTILQRSVPRWSDVLEPHDSFYIGSDVFYTYIVQNGIWWARQRWRNPESFLEGAESARRNVIRGHFPVDIRRQFSDMLDYFGQSPIIVRSSSLLEDNFGNAFAGKYESVFCANQGSRDKRLEDFESAVRTIYASTMSEKALRYRAQRGLLDRDEQMALLVQRVSGMVHEGLFYPQIAGVGFSYNPYRWSEDIDPEAGMLRLVFGLGTRAVDRSDDDYTRVVALNAPDKHPEGGSDDMSQYCQRRVDVLDLEANQLVASRFADVVERSPSLPIEMFASRDVEMERRAVRAGVKGVFPWALTFRKLLSETDYVSDMREMLRVLGEAYDYPVDVEFTMNFLSDHEYKIDLVQCRPLQVKGGGAIADPPSDLGTEDLLLEASGAVIGQSRLLVVDRIVYVVPSVYGRLPVPDRHAIARLVGRVVQLDRNQTPAPSVLLMGPGRWGTTTPSLGVPASFTEINAASALCEIVAMRDDLIPDVSLGTHYFSDLVEMDILYMALFPGRGGNSLNPRILEGATSQLSSLLPEAKEWSEVVRVIDAKDLTGGRILLNANTLKQRVVCYVDRDGVPESPSEG
jgi:pyruvate, water dikinase